MLPFHIKAVFFKLSQAAILKLLLSSLHSLEQIMQLCKVSFRLRLRGGGDKRGMDIFHECIYKQIDMVNKLFTKS